jgi:hypothetical protein
MDKTVNADETVAAQRDWRFQRTVPYQPEAHHSVTVPDRLKVLGYFSQVARLRLRPIGSSRLHGSGDLAGMAIVLAN